MHFFTDIVLHTNPLWVYILVPVILLLESTGVPIINSTLLLFTGALASQGHFNIWVLGSGAMIGSIIGAVIAYHIGASGGRHVLLRMMRFFRIDVRKLELVEGWFRRFGIGLVFWSRIIPYIRPYSCFPAGMTHMHFVPFFTSAALGSIVWCSVALAVGWHLGKRWELAVRLLQEYTLPTLCGIALLLVLYLVASYYIKRFISARLQATTDATSAEQSSGSDLLGV